MDSQSITHLPNLSISQSPNSSIPHPPKEAWTQPVLRVTPIAETAGTKSGLDNDGSGFSS